MAPQMAPQQMAPLGYMVASNEHFIDNMLNMSYNYFLLLKR